jgi:hypothetical protein
MSLWRRAVQQFIFGKDIGFDDAEAISLAQHVRLLADQGRGG